VKAWKKEIWREMVKTYGGGLALLRGHGKSEEVGAKKIGVLGMEKNKQATP